MVGRQVLIHDPASCFLPPSPPAQRIQRMSSYEDLFEISVLDIIAPPPSLEFPSGYSPDKASEWLARVQGSQGDRKTVFFGAYALLYALLV